MGLKATMRQIADYGHNTAENILWHPQEAALYWLDIPAGKMFRGYFPDLKCGDGQLGRFESACILTMTEPVGGFVFCQRALNCKTRFLLFGAAGRIYEWEYESDCQQQAKPRLYHQVDPAWVPDRFNDVLALPSGTSPTGGSFVLCGTMPSDVRADSRLLLFNVAKREVELVQENLKLANGMGLSPRRDFLYFADTRDFAVYRFPVLSLSQGRIDWGAREELINFHGRPGRPDGLCVDGDGRIWLAETGAGQISCFAPDGREQGVLEVGTPKVTSCCFGGNMLNILFVATQGGEGISGKAGGIFAANSWLSEGQEGPQISSWPRWAGKYVCGQEEVLL